ncbi:MAG: hypothetical protein R3E18_08165 [Sphingomonadaceae bacterium]|nr:hypothetical protein [Sphingomonadaceae bacterium]
MMTQSPPSLLAKLFAAVQPAAGESARSLSPSTEKPEIPGFSVALANLAVARQGVSADESVKPALPQLPGESGKALPPPAPTGKNLPPVAAPALATGAQPPVVPVMRSVPGLVVPPKAPEAPAPEVVPVSEPLRDGKLATKPADHPTPVSRYIKAARKPLETPPIMEREKETVSPGAHRVKLYADPSLEEGLEADASRPTMRLVQPVTIPETDLAPVAELLPVNPAPVPTPPNSIPVAEAELGKGQKAENPAPATARTPGAPVAEAETPRPQAPSATPVVISAVPRRALAGSGGNGKAPQPTRPDISEPQKFEGTAPQALPTLANASPRAGMFRSSPALLDATSGTERDTPQQVAALKQALPVAVQPVPQTPAQAATMQPAIQTDFPAPAMPTTSAIAPAITPAMDSAAIAHLVDQLSAAREAFAPVQAQLSLDHAEFGEIDLRFSQARGGALQVEMTAEDPALPRALAAAQPAVQAGEQAGNFRQNDSASQPRMAGGAERDLSGSAGEGRGREDARRDQPARQQRQTQSDSSHRGSTPHGTYA